MANPYSNAYGGYGMYGGGGGGYGGYGGYGNPYAAYGYAAPTTSAAMGGGVDTGVTNAIWMGDIENWMEDNYIWNLFAQTGEVTQVKLMKNKTTSDKVGGAIGYAFIYFATADAAARALNAYNNQPIPGLPGRHFRLNWAAHGNKGGVPGTASVQQPLGSVPPPNSESLSLFVGDLANDVTDVTLLYAFHSIYPSAYSAKVVYDPNTNQSKSYGFVYFKDERERNRAITEMQGYQLSYRPIRVNIASKRNNPSAATPSVPAGPTLPPPSASSLNSPDNKTIFIYGLDSSIDQETLRNSFSAFGEITLIKVFPSKGYSFIDFATHEQAEHVLNSLPSGAIIGNCTVKISWGKPSGNSVPSSSSSVSSSVPSSYPYPSSQPYIPPVSSSASQQSERLESESGYESHVATNDGGKEGQPQGGAVSYENEEYEPEGSDELPENQTNVSAANPKRELEESTKDEEEKQSKRLRKDEEKSSPKEEKTQEKTEKLEIPEEKTQDNSKQSEDKSE